MTVIFVGGETSILEYRLMGGFLHAPSLSAPRKRKVGRMPSFLRFCGDGKRALVVSEEENLLTSFVRASGELTPKSVVPCPGGPAYVATDRSGDWALTACYGSGQVRAYRFYGDGTLSPRAVLFPSGRFTHAVVPSPNEGMLIAAVKGTDRLLQLRLDPKDGSLTESTSQRTRSGSGPRHLAVSPDGQQVYLICESDCTLMVYDVLKNDVHKEDLRLRSVVCTLPCAPGPGDTGADVHVSDDGRHVYVSNRGHDSLSVFQRNASGVELIQNLPTGAVPRNFCLLGTEGLICANQEDRSLSFFRRDEQKGTLKRAGDVPLSERPFWVGSHAST